MLFNRLKINYQSFFNLIIFFFLFFGLIILQFNYDVKNFKKAHAVSVPTWLSDQFVKVSSPDGTKYYIKAFNDPVVSQNLATKFNALTSSPYVNPNLSTLQRVAINQYAERLVGASVLSEEAGRLIPQLQTEYSTKIRFPTTKGELLQALIPTAIAIAKDTLKDEPQPGRVSHVDDPRLSFLWNAIGVTQSGAIITTALDFELGLLGMSEKDAIDVRNSQLTNADQVKKMTLMSAGLASLSDISKAIDSISYHYPANSPGAEIIFDISKKLDDIIKVDSSRELYYQVKQNTISALNTLFNRLGASQCLRHDYGYTSSGFKSTTDSYSIMKDCANTLLSNDEYIALYYLDSLLYTDIISANDDFNDSNISNVAYKVMPYGNSRGGSFYKSYDKYDTESYYLPNSVLQQFSQMLKLITDNGFPTTPTYQLVRPKISKQQLKDAVANISATPLEPVKSVFPALDEIGFPRNTYVLESPDTIKFVVDDTIISPEKLSNNVNINDLAISFDPLITRDNSNGYRYHQNYDPSQDTEIDRLIRKCSDLAIPREECIINDPTVYIDPSLGVVNIGDPNFQQPNTALKSVTNCLANNNCPVNYGLPVSPQTIFNNKDTVVPPTGAGGGSGSSTNPPVDPNPPVNPPVDPNNPIFDLTKPCPTGYFKDLSGGCVPMPDSNGVIDPSKPCPVGYVKDVSGGCVPFAGVVDPLKPPVTADPTKPYVDLTKPCPVGYQKLNSGECQIIVTPDPLKPFECPANYTKSGVDKCIPLFNPAPIQPQQPIVTDPLSCPANTFYNGSGCVDPNDPTKPPVNPVPVTSKPVPAEYECPSTWLLGAWGVNLNKCFDPNDPTKPPVYPKSKTPDQYSCPVGMIKNSAGDCINPLDPLQPPQKPCNCPACSSNSPSNSPSPSLDPLQSSNNPSKTDSQGKPCNDCDNAQQIIKNLRENNLRDQARTAKDQKNDVNQDGVPDALQNLFKDQCVENNTKDKACHVTLTDFLALDDVSTSDKIRATINAVENDFKSDILLKKSIELSVYKADDKLPIILTFAPFVGGALLTTCSNPALEFSAFGYYFEQEINVCDYFSPYAKASVTLILMAWAFVSTFRFYRDLQQIIK